MQQIVRDELTPVMYVTDTLRTVASDVLPHLLCLQVNLNNNAVLLSLFKVLLHRVCYILVMKLKEVLMHCLCV